MKQFLKSLFPIFYSKPIIKSLLPVCYSKPFDQNYDQNIIRTFGLQRSGQHLVIEWISRGLIDVIHLNHCRFYPSGLSLVLKPVTGRRVIYSEGTVDDSGIQGRNNFQSSLPSKSYRNLLYSLEDVSLKDVMIQKLDQLFKTKTVLILRDPVNWLASSIQHNRSSKEALLRKRNILIEYLEQATLTKKYIKNNFVAINYNKFTIDPKYRQRIAEKLNLVSFEDAEKALNHTSDFGQGSSFKNLSNANNTLERWKLFQDDPFFRYALKNQNLIDLSIDFFGNVPGLSELT